jgi:lipoyl(octanoyl) transferase
MRPTPKSPPLEVYLLGLVDFAEVQQLQRRIVYELGENGGAVLILCEHPPTISVGRAGSRAHIIPDDDGLREMGIRVRWVNRGGGCVLHLPGQLAIYLAAPLVPLGLSLSDYLACLHRAMIGVLDEFDLRGVVRRDVPGVFSGDARIGTVGIAVNRWIAHHGMTLNVNPYLEPFDVIDEPGIARERLRSTSMEARRQRQTSMSRVRESVIRQLEQALGIEQHHIYTNHPLIATRVRPNVHASSVR